MNSSQLEQMQDALMGLCQAQSGKIQALEITVRALMVTVGAQSEADSDALRELITGLAEEERPNLDTESMIAFESTIGSMSLILSAIAESRG